MIALIDADIVAYRTAAVNEKADFPLARWQADQLITRIIEDVNASDWRLYLTSGNNNFRYTVYPDYKANRRDVPKPRHLEDLREYLVRDWDAVLVDGYEADDAIGIESQRGCSASEDSKPTKCIVCSIDKDLRQLPGTHYDFVKRQIIDISSADGQRNFFWQLLVGDATDNIKGCPGIGPVKAERALRNCKTLDQFYETCFQAYFEAYEGNIVKANSQLDLNAQLIYIHRQENDNWQRLLKPPTDELKQEVAVTSESSQKTQNTSSESTTAEKPDGSQ